MMPPLYSGSADEWSYLSNDATNSPLKTVDFIIDNFENEMKKVSTPLKSHQFTVKHTHWHIEVVASRKFKDGKDYIAVYLRNNNNMDFTVDCKLEIGGKVINMVNLKIPVNSMAGVHNILTHEACKKVLINGKLKVKMDIQLLQEESTLIHGRGTQSNSTAETNVVNHKIFDTKPFTDFQVVCNGKVFPCHKAFLVTRSPIFKNMLESNMKEANDGSVEINNHTEVVVESFVKFFYTSHVEEEVLNEQALSFLDLGEQYELKGLKKVAELAMIAQLDTENMLKFFIAGDMYHGDEIKEAAKAFIRKNRTSLIEQEGWREVSTDRDLLLDLIESFSKD